MKVILLLLLTTLLLTLTPTALSKSPQRSRLSLVPPSAELHAWAVDWRDTALRSYARWNRLRSCYGLAPKRLAPERPARSAPAVVWLQAAREWRDAARTAGDRRAHLWREMTAPAGGGAARWRPLIDYYWPDYLVAKAVWVVAMESGGNHLARNRYSGAAGLFQLYPAPAGWDEPATNVRLAYAKYRAAGGWSPWVVCR